VIPEESNDFDMSAAIVRWAFLSYSRRVEVLKKSSPIKRN